MNTNYIRLQLSLHKYGLSAYDIFKNMHFWLVERDIVHSFEFPSEMFTPSYPISIVLDEESAVVFKLAFSL